MEAVDDRTFHEALAESHHRPVLVYFWAPWCTQCNAVGPLVGKLASAYTRSGSGPCCLKCNVDDSHVTAAQYQIMTLPVDIAPLVDRLEVFKPYKQPNSWPPLLRRPLLRLMAGDADLLLGELQPLLRPVGDALNGYSAKAARE